MWVAFATYIFFTKNINVFAIFQERNFNVTLANNVVTFWTTGPRKYSYQTRRKSMLAESEKNKTKQKRIGTIAKFSHKLIRQDIT